MKGLTTFAIATTLLSTCSEAIQLHKRTDGPPRVVGFPVQRNTIPNPLLRDRLRRRSGTVQATLANEETFYIANVSLGTPAQSVRLQIDTGSSDLWVNTPSSTLCESKGNPCEFAGTYSANSSSTYSFIASDFNISYVDGSGASGDYASDKITIGSTEINSLQFGIGYSSSSCQGVLGIGYPVNEVWVSSAGKSAYNNLPAQMVADGLIQSNAYSLWLNDLESSTGTILFGGVDTAQYHGFLESLPIQKESGIYQEFLITLTEVMFGSTVIAESQALAVLLDSGSSLTYLPDAMAEAIYEEVNAQYEPTAEAAYVPCSLANNSTTLNFTFSSPTISVAMSELVIAVAGPNGEQLTFSDGSPACLFGIAPAGSSTSVLGDTFIRSAYLVYDLDSNEISIAQTNFNATTTNVQEISTGSTGVPDAAMVTNVVTATAGISGGSIVTLGLGGTATSKAGVERTAAPMHLGAMAAVGAGIFYAAM